MEKELHAYLILGKKILMCKGDNEVSVTHFAAPLGRHSEDTELIVLWIIVQLNVANARPQPRVKETAALPQLLSPSLTQYFQYSYGL